MLKTILNMLGLLRHSDSATGIYEMAVNEARREEYYGPIGVPDSIDGRFDMITLIVSLALNRIGKIGKNAKKAKNLAQEVFDVMFADMEQNLREIGISDEGMKYRIREMAGGFMGRMRTYGRLSEENNATTDELLEQWSAAVSRNVFRIDNGICPTAMALSHRVIAIISFLDTLDDGDILDGKITFPNFSDS